MPKQELIEMEATDDPLESHKEEQLRILMAPVWGPVLVGHPSIPITLIGISSSLTTASNSLARVLPLPSAGVTWVIYWAPGMPRMGKWSCTSTSLLVLDTSL